MSRPNILQVALPADSAAVLKRNALNLGLKPAAFARLLLMQALGGPTLEKLVGALKPKKAPRG